MTRDEALDEIEAIIDQARVQAMGMMDERPESPARELAEDILSVAEQIQ